MPRLIKLGIAGILLITPLIALGQDAEVPLGDVARSYRRPVTDDRPVIDNDNLPQLMTKAEIEHLGGKPVFSIDPSGKSFRISSPDGSCSLSFDAKATALISNPVTTSSLPLDELARLDGTASIHDGVIEVALHNGTAWDLKEIVVGLTVLNPRGALLRSANLLGPTEGLLVPRVPDLTMLYHLKATDLPDGAIAFRGNLDQDFGPTVDWHWALVGARGVPPAAPPILPQSSVSSRFSSEVSTPQIAPIAAAGHTDVPAQSTTQPPTSAEPQR
ncbi:MAG TPA: hypothetical protein VFM77_15090 [Terriglobales bacterium]|nr:hypothetical protein [Terriglobales bacterium]